MNTKTSRDGGMRQFFEIHCTEVEHRVCFNYTDAGETKEQALLMAELDNFKFIRGKWYCEECAKNYLPTHKENTPCQD